MSSGGKKYEGVSEETKASQKRLHEILEKHDVEQMVLFIKDHPVQFAGVKEELRLDRNYLYSLLHLYKAMLPYFGEMQRESLSYCLKHGILKYERGGEDGREEADLSDLQPGNSGPPEES